MPFGRYRGLYVADLPDDYLRWLQGLDDLRGRLRRAVDAEWRSRRLRADYRDDPSEATLPFQIDAGDKPLLQELLRSGYRALAAKYHPDVGGDPDTMRRLNALMEKLRETWAA
jgi:hypothetical protein